MRTHWRLLTLVPLCGVLYWLIDTALDSSSSPEGSIWASLFRPTSTPELIERVAVLAVSLILAYVLVVIHVQRTKLVHTLADREKLYRQAISQANAFTYQLDPIDMKYTYVSPDFERLTGFKPEEFGPDLWSDLEAHWEMRGACAGLTHVEAADRIRKGTLSVWQADVRIKTRSGEIRWLADTAVAQADASGRAICSIGILQDITDRKRAEERMLRQHLRAQRLQAAVVDMAIHSSMTSGNLPRAASAITEIAAEAMGIDRVSIWLLSEDGTELRCLDLYEASGNSHSSGASLKSAEYPRYFEALKSMRALDASDARSDPRTSEFKDECLDAHGIGSMLDSAVRCQGQVVGVVRFEHVGDPRVWGSDEITFAGETADQTAHLLLNVEHQQAAAAQARSEMIYRQAIENARGVPYQLTFATGRYEFVGLGIEDLTGIPREKFSFEALVDLVQEITVLDSNWQRDSHTYGLAFRDGSVDQFRVDFRIITPSGQERWLSDSAVPVCDEVTGRVVGALGILQDITDRKRAEISLTRLKVAVEQATESIVITDPFGVIEYVNPAYERTTGYSVAEVLGRTERFLNSGKHDQRLFQEIWATIKRGETWFGKIINRRKDGQLIDEEVSFTPVIGANGERQHVIEVKRDVSREVRLEGQLRQAQKMEAIGQLAGGVAHDFNNLLLAIQGHTDLALDGLAKNSPMRQELEQVQAAAERAAGLTRQLLAFSRRQVLQQVPLDLNEVVRDLVKMLRRLIGENIDLDLRLGPQVGQVDADRGLIEQVVMNLCVNARDAMPDGGRIIIRTDSACPLLTNHSGKLAKAGSFCRLIISDTGMGIPTEDLDHIFEPFFTTKEVGKGTGLGLATVYGVVQQHGGTIDVRSEVGRGTVFEISLPCVDRDSPRHEGKAAPPAEGGSETVLVAEDEQVVRDLAVRILTKGGYKVLTAEDGVEAVEVFRSRGDNIDLLLLDVVMPKLSGRAVYEQIRRMAPNIPVLFTSGYDPDVTQPRFFHDHDKRLLTKPYSPDDLLRSVRDIIDSAAAQSSRTPVR